MRLIALGIVLFSAAAHGEPWGQAPSVTVDITESASSMARIERHRQNEETLVLFSIANAPQQRVLIIPGIAILRAGVPASTTCPETYDALAYVASLIALPLHYLAEALPEGAQSFGAEATRQFTVPEGPMAIDAGNFVQVKRPLSIAVNAKRETDGTIRYRISERGTSDPEDKATRYAGTWSSTLTAQFPSDASALRDWLPCTSGRSNAAPSTIGELRALRRTK